MHGVESLTHGLSFSGSEGGGFDKLCAATVEDAAQEFLTDWLVRRQYDQALEFLSSRAYACLNLDDAARTDALDAAGARRELRRLMEYATGKMGRGANLASATLEVAPRDPKVVIVDHPFRREFLLTPLTEAATRPYFCDQAVPVTGAEYFGVVFRFRRASAGILGLLWTREAGRWRLVAYRALTP